MKWIHSLVITSLVVLAGVSFAGTPPSIVTAPQPQAVITGSMATFNVVAEGEAPLSYRWRRNGTNILGATNDSTLTLWNVSVSSTGRIAVVITNAFGSVTSAPVSLTVTPPLPILTGPPDAVGVTGSYVLWSVDLVNPPATLSLVFEETNIVVGNLYRTSSPVYFSLQNLQTNQSGHYTVIASNGSGWSTSRVATLTVTNLPPIVGLFISPTQAVEGNTVNFAHSGGGGPTPQYSLFHNGVLLLAVLGLGSGYSIPSVSLVDAGQYTLVASNVAGVATSTGYLGVRRAGPLDRWTRRNALPAGSDLHSVVWGQNQFVTVGDVGTVRTSPDGTNWTTRATPTARPLYGVTYGNGRFVAVGQSGTVLTSTNGETWALGTADTNATFFSATFGNGHFLAVGTGYGPSFTPVAFRSTNGTDWNAVTVPPACCNPYGFLAATFGAGRFVLTDNAGAAYSSAGLVSWTNTGFFVALAVEGAAYVNGSFVAVGEGGSLNVSPDGLTWPPSYAYSNNVSSRTLYGVAHGAGRYLVAGAKGALTATTNLQTWTPVPSPTEDNLEDIIFANGLFVAVGESGTILTSSTGLNWTNHTTSVKYDLDGLAVGNGLAVAVGKGGTILTSSNGTTWNFLQAPAPPGGLPSDLHGVAYGQGKWIAVGESSKLVVSADGVNWQLESPAPLPFPFYDMKSILYASNLWVAVGVAGQIFTSSDGVTWAAAVSPTSYDLNEVAFGNGLFVVAGDNNLAPDATILTSSDGVNWQQDASTYTAENARGVAFADGQFVIPSNDGILLHGLPGGWQVSNPGVYTGGNNGNLRGATWSHRTWVVVGNNGLLITSTNAQTWRARTTPVTKNLHAVRQFNNTFIVVGNGGTILQSAPLLPQVSITREGAQLRLVFSSPYEGVFKLQQTDDFTWSDLADITIAEGPAEFVVPLPPGSGQKFFRVIAP